MNEDDTIRILKRTPFKELRESEPLVRSGFFPPNSKVLDECLKKHGWTIDEYKASLALYNELNPPISLMSFLKKKDD